MQLQKLKTSKPPKSNKMAQDPWDSLPVQETFFYNRDVSCAIHYPVKSESSLLNFVDAEYKTELVSKDYQLTFELDGELIDTKWYLKIYPNGYNESNPHGDCIVGLVLIKLPVNDLIRVESITVYRQYYISQIGFANRGETTYSSDYAVRLWPAGTLKNSKFLQYDVLHSGGFEITVTFTIESIKYKKKPAMIKINNIISQATKSTTSNNNNSNNNKKKSMNTKDNINTNDKKIGGINIGNGSTMSDDTNTSEEKEKETKTKTGSNINEIISIQDNIKGNIKGNINGNYNGNCSCNCNCHSSDMISKKDMQRYNDNIMKRCDMLSATMIEILNKMDKLANDVEKIQIENEIYDIKLPVDKSKSFDEKTNGNDHDSMAAQASMTTFGKWILNVFDNDSKIGYNYINMIIVDQGIDDIEMFSKLTDKELKQIGIHKKGHRMKFLTSMRAHTKKVIDEETF